MICYVCVWGDCPQTAETQVVWRKLCFFIRVSRFLLPELGDLTNLGVLFLHQNQLSGELPPTLGNLTSVRQITLFGNQFSGPVPEEFGNLVSISQLMLYDNQLTGEIPASIADLTNLTSFSIEDNQGLCATSTLNDAPWYDGDMLCE